MSVARPRITKLRFQFFISDGGPPMFVEFKRLAWFEEKFALFLMRRALNMGKLEQEAEPEEEKP